MPRRAEVDPRFPERLRELRNERGLSLQALARAAFVSKSHISEMEHRNKTPGVETAQALDKALQANGELSDMVREPERCGQVVSQLDRRDFLSAVAGLALGASREVGLLPHIADLTHTALGEPLRRVGAGDVERIAATTRAFREWDNRWGGGLSRAAVTAQLEWVVTTAKTCVCSTDVRQRLLQAVADLAGVAAFMSYDVEHHDGARHLWLLALDASREGNDPGLVGATLRCLAHQSLHLKRPDEALGLVGLASAMATDASGDVIKLAMAETAAYRGWCHAAVGSTQQCYGALGQAEELFTSVNLREPVPDWLSHFNLAELRALQGHAYYVLAGSSRLPAAALKARPLLEAAVAARDAAYSRSKALNLIALSATYFQAGQDLDVGVQLGREALDGVSELSSPRSQSRLNELRAATDPHTRISAVADLRADLDTVLTHDA